MSLSLVIWVGVAACAGLAAVALKGRRWFEAGSYGALAAAIAFTALGLADRLGPVMLLLAGAALASFVGHVIRSRRSRRLHPRGM